MIKQLTLAIVAALTLTTASAADMAWASNQSGGRIVLKASKCPDDSSGLLKQLYTIGKGGKTTYGCWWFEKASGLIHVVWSDDGSRFTYDAKSFTFF